VPNFFWLALIGRRKVSGIEGQSAAPQNAAGVTIRVRLTSARCKSPARWSPVNK
jgi:hypothetical protein